MEQKTHSILKEYKSESTDDSFDIRTDMSDEEKEYLLSQLQKACEFEEQGEYIKSQKIYARYLDHTLIKSMDERFDKVHLNEIKIDFDEFKDFYNQNKEHFKKARGVSSEFGFFRSFYEYFNSGDISNYPRYRCSACTVDRKLVMYLYLGKNREENIIDIHSNDLNSNIAPITINIYKLTGLNCDEEEIIDPSVLLRPEVKEAIEKMKEKVYNALANKE